MNCYVESGIHILNDTTKDLENLNELGIYLARETNVDALKLLKLIVLASETKLLEKSFDINHVKTYTDPFENSIYNSIYKRNETVFGNLAVNPQNLGLELADYILHNYKVDLNIEYVAMNIPNDFIVGYGLDYDGFGRNYPFTTGYTIFDFFARSFARIEYDEDPFYKRYDMIDKKLDMISYMLDYELLDNIQTDLLLTYFDRCIQNKYSYTNEQLLKMKEITNQVNSKRQIILTVEELFKQDKIKSDYSKEELSKKLLSTNKDKDVNNPSDITESFNRLENYWMLNDQCTYMLRTIPRLVKEKVIK